MLVNHNLLGLYHVAFVKRPVDNVTFILNGVISRERIIDKKFNGDISFECGVVFVPVL